MKKSDKKAEMPVYAIVGIIIVVFVFVIILIGVSRGWFDNITRLGSFTGGNNVEATKNSCRLACLDNKVDDFCVKERTLRLDNDRSVIGSCASFTGLGVSGVSISWCEKFSCSGEVKNPVCKDGLSTVECSKFK